MSGKLRSLSIAFAGVIALAAVGLFAYTVHAAYSFTVTLRPPAGLSGTTVLPLGLSGVTANSDGSYTLTDAQSAKTLIGSGWRIVVPVSFSGGANAVVSTATINYYPFDGISAGNANEGDVIALVAQQATVSGLTCSSTAISGSPTAPGTSNTYVITLDHNLAASTITCTISGAATSCTDTTHSVVAALGDNFDYSFSPTGTPTAIVPHCSVLVTL